DAVDPAVRVDDPAPRVLAHARAAHVVVAADLVVGGEILEAVDPAIEPYPADTAGSQFRAEEFGGHLRGTAVEVVEVPVQVGAGNAEGVHPIGQHDAVVRARRLLPGGPQQQAADEPLPESLE